MTLGGLNVAAVTAPPARRPLGVAAWVSLTPQQLERLERLEAYDLGFVTRRLAAGGRVPDEHLEAAVFEFRRFMALNLLEPAGIGLYQADVDEVWHQLILFTREYHQFCQAVFGAFLHHVPETEAGGPDPDGHRQFYELYLATFGELNQEW